MKANWLRQSHGGDGMQTPTNYVASRTQFRRITAELGWQLHSHAINAVGPNQEELTVDVCVSPSVQGDHTLVVSSGLHGVEGHFGCQVQVQQLDQWRHAPLPHGVRIIMLHALNPFGFAWSRRVDEQNRDLNRNFLLDGESYSGSPSLYAQIDPFLNPRRPPSRSEPFLLKAMSKIARYGFRALQSAIAGGQYDFPAGLFYGGSKPSQLNQWLSQELSAWLEGSKRVVHLDLHTGLGKPGQLSLLIESELTDKQRRDLDGWYGEEAYVETSHSPTAYRAKGSFGKWCVTHSDVDDYLYACVEIGTVHPLLALRALRAENQSYHWGDPTAPSTAITKRRLQQVFYPARSDWRHNACRKTSDVIQQTVRMLRFD